MGIKNGERISMEIIASIKSKIRLKKWGHSVCFCGFMHDIVGVRLKVALPLC